jgi:hypothetical protein
MRKLAMALGIAAAMVLAGGVAWKAEATSLKSGTVNLPGVAKNYSPVQQTACRGWGAFCPPGYTWRCGPYKCKCRPCW